MTELEKIKEKWKKENLTPSKIDENLNSLEEIYVLTYYPKIWDWENLKESQIKKLLDERLITQKITEKGVSGAVGGQTIYQTTEIGNKIAQELENEIKDKLDKCLI